ncbi:MAG: phospho-sugar mutase [Opitutales bacterium]
MSKDTHTAIQDAAARGDLLESAREHLTAWLDSGHLPDWAEAAIGELVADAAWEELNDRFYQTLAFGTGGMRGRTIGRTIAPTEQGDAGPKDTPEYAAIGSNMLNDINVVKATVGLYRYAADYLAEAGRYESPRLVIAHDVRHFSRHFCELAASVWSRLGGTALIFEGPRSTPQLSYTVRHLRATCGVVITASHNPPHDNGYKVYFEDGAQIVSPHAEGIIDQVNDVDLQTLAGLLEKDLTEVQTLDEAVDQAYLDVLGENILDAEVLQKEKPTIVFTPIHGTGRVMSVPLMEQYGIRVEHVEAQDVFDPNFPTVQSPNPENAEALALGMERADAVGADIVMATDPDADRMGVAVRNRDGKLRLLTGNMIGSVLAEYRIQTYKDGGVLPERGTGRAALIKTFVTTGLQAAIAEAHGLKVINTLTGFKYIGEKLRDYEETLKRGLFEEEGIALDYDATAQDTRAELLQEYATFYVFGGEESYGYLGSDRVRDKDANAAVIMFCELAAWLKSQDMTVEEYLDSLYLKYGYYLESLINIVYEGAAGSVRIKKILDTYRTDPPKTFGGVQVTGFRDFGREDIVDADGKVIPKQDFYILELANGYSYAVRGSGTEPKIKFYLFAREDVADADALPGLKAETQAKLAKLAEAIEADARTRAEG